MTKYCEWTEDDDGIYDTQCGNRHEFFEGGPSENNYKHCPYCGGTLIQKGNNNDDN